MTTQMHMKEASRFPAKQNAHPTSAGWALHYNDDGNNEPGCGASPGSAKTINCEAGR
jgi:hypothetical protein